MDSLTDAFQRLRQRVGFLSGLGVLLDLHVDEISQASADAFLYLGSSFRSSQWGERYPQSDC